MALRTIAPFLSEEAGVHKYDIEVVGRDDLAPTRVVLRDRSLFGITQIDFSPKSAREVAACLIRAAALAERGQSDNDDGDESKTVNSNSSVPKLVPVR